jgi:hypothetical protein
MCGIISGNAKFHITVYTTRDSPALAVSHAPVPSSQVKISAQADGGGNSQSRRSVGCMSGRGKLAFIYKIFISSQGNFIMYL